MFFPKKKSRKFDVNSYSIINDDTLIHAFAFTWGDDLKGLILCQARAFSSGMGYEIELEVWIFG